MPTCINGLMRKLGGGSIDGLVLICVWILSFISLMFFTVIDSVMQP